MLKCAFSKRIKNVQLKQYEKFSSMEVCRMFEAKKERRVFVNWNEMRMQNCHRLCVKFLPNN